MHGASSHPNPRNVASLRSRNQARFSCLISDSSLLLTAERRFAPTTVRYRRISVRYESEWVSAFIGIRMRLDSGEISVLSLCLQTQWAACIDESAGRRVARALELECFGTFGLLRHGIDQRWMTDHKALEVVRRLRSRGLFCPKVLPDDSFTRYFARLG